MFSCRSLTCCPRVQVSVTSLSPVGSVILVMGALLGHGGTSGLGLPFHWDFCLFAKLRKFTYQEILPFLMYVAVS